MEPHELLKKNELRQNAEAQFRQRNPSGELPRSAEEAQHLLYELQVHQIELEIQKEELEWAKQDLADSNVHLKELLAAIPVPINVTRASDGKLLFNNPKFQEFFGLFPLLPEQQQNGDSLYLLTEERERLLEELRTKGKVDNYETSFTSETGEERWIVISMQQIHFQGEVSILSAINDMTERKRAEQELSAFNQRLEGLVEERTHELVQLNREKNEFLGIAAHNLKNPLSSILTSAEILKRNVPQDVSVQRFTTTSMNACHQMLDIITNLLDVNRIEQGLVSLNVEPVSLHILDDIVKEYQVRAAQKGIIVNAEIPREDSFRVLADKHSFRQIFDNILSNAVKYSFQWKSIWVRVAKRIYEEGDFVRIEVQDQGPGLTVEDHEKLFGKFARLSARPTSGEHSTGLGLSIVKRLVEMQQGRVWCESVRGQGATFIFELPSIEDSEKGIFAAKSM